MKILCVTTVSSTVNTFLIPHIKMLIEQGHQVDVAFNIDHEINPDIKEMGCKVHVIPIQRSPLRKENYRAYKILKKAIIHEKYGIVHTHTPVASAIVRLVCKNFNNVKVFYTAHGFHFFKGAPVKNWLIYYPIEKWLSRHTDVLITINKEDYQRARKTFKAGSVEYIPGVGIDVSKFGNVMVDKTVKRKELDLPEDAFVVLSVGELNKNKNHEIIIKAIAKLHNSNMYYVVCGQGPLENYLKDLADKLGIGNRFKLLGFREDIIEILKTSDIFTFPSFREGLPVALMEAIASGLPCAVSKIRGNVDLIDKKGGVLFDPASVDSCKAAIEQLMKADMDAMGVYNNEKIKKFEVGTVIDQIKNLYKK